MPKLPIDHVQICVRDLDRSLAFYRDGLGMKVQSDRTQDTTTGIVALTYKKPHAKRRIAFLTYGEGALLFTIIQIVGDPPDGQAIMLDQIGISHLSFTVPSVAHMTQKLLAKGYKTCAPPDAFKNKEGRLGTMFFHDPDGILVQLGDEAGGGG